MSSTESKDVVVSKTPGKIEVLSFAVSLDPQQSLVVVGTITCLSSGSAIVWFGWGSTAAADAQKDTHSIGTGVPPSMGPMVVAMPQTSYRGAFPDAVASSLLISQGVDEEDGMLANQASTRLTKKLGKPVFMSCCLASGAAAPQQSEELGGGADDASSMAQHAAALAEREVARILIDKWN